MKAVQKILVSAALLASAGAFGAANAADINSRSFKDDPDYRPAVAWTGFYAGIHLGGSFNDELKTVVTETYLQSGALATNPVTKYGDLDGAFLGGLQVGYNLQVFGNLVIGVEGDISKSSADLTEYLGSIRGRLGYAAGKTLFYGTGGVGFVNWDDNTVLDTSWGWVAGAGIEHKLTSNLSLGVEGLYYSLDDEGQKIYGDPTYPANQTKRVTEFERDLWTVRARLNYHFGTERESLK